MTRWSACLVLLLGCGGGGGGAGGDPAEPAPAPSAADLEPLCQRFYDRERACVDDYLDRLLDVRVEYDMPPGIGADLERDGREAMIAGMRADWERDMAPDNTDRLCRAVVEVPAERVESLLAEGEHCMAQPDCATFAHCAVETERTYIQSGAPPH